MHFNGNAFYRLWKLFLILFFALGCKNNTAHQPQKVPSESSSVSNDCVVNIFMSDEGLGRIRNHECEK